MKVFKKDTSGKIRFLEVFSDKDELVQRSGVVDGKVIERRSTRVGKNIGKTNETTGAEQAIKEAASKIINKMSEGYFATYQEAVDSNVILPMLATSYDKVADKVEYPCYAQPKLDGMRSLYANVKNQFTSRKGKIIDTIPHITSIVESTADVIFDGELYAHGLSFQEVMSLIKSPKTNSHKIKLWVYDMVMENEPFDERYAYLTSFKFSKHVQKVHTRLINNEEELITYHAENIQKGYEGTMVRWGETGYEVNKRSKSLLKYKDFKDIAVPIIDVVPSDKDPEQGIFECQTDSTSVNNGIFRCGMKYSHKERKEILRNKQNYIGRIAEVRFFEYTDDGLPRFPVCVGLRLDK